MSYFETRKAEILGSRQRKPRPCDHARQREARLSQTMKIRGQLKAARALEDVLMRAKKVDATHGPIRDHLRAIGFSVLSTAAVGRDVPDLLVADGAKAALVECKTGRKQRTAGQVKFAAEWRGVVIEARTGLEAEQKIKAAWRES